MALFTKNPNSYGLIGKNMKLYAACCTDTDACCVSTTSPKPKPDPKDTPKDPGK